ncbi:hypothetical protein VIGAN_05268900, partial [Vigna angularis var. angularis]
YYRKLGCLEVNQLIHQLKKIINSFNVQIQKHRQREISKTGRKINYLSHIRPDITYAVNVVSQFMHDPRKLHMDVVERILRYLKSTPKKGILFSNHGNLKVEGYTDANCMKESCNLKE